MSDSFDERIGEWLAQGSASRGDPELSQTLADTAKLLGAFRHALVCQEFSPQGAEDVVRDYYNALLYRAESHEDE